MEVKIELSDQQIAALAEERSSQVVPTLFSDRVVLTGINGVNTMPIEGIPLLSALILDGDKLEPIHHFDEIGQLIHEMDREGDEDWVQKLYAAAIESLQSGIDRLKAHEAKRRQAQS